MAGGRSASRCARPASSPAATRARRSSARTSPPEQAGVGTERARALTELGALPRRANRRREARALLAEALDIAHGAGAVMLAEHVETELRATGARPRRAMLRGVASLTASERRVAELAADGLTNREIAQARS